jgi:phage terminase large subunit-like protein
VADRVQFRLTAKQEEAQAILAGQATHGMLYGGSRSGKTFLHVRNVILRALKASGSRHVILRFRFNHIKASVILDTFPKVMKLCFPEVEYSMDKTDWFATLPNGSQIWFGGLDDKARTEKILGQEYVTVYLNEASQISKDARDMAMTRLAQQCELDGQPGKYLKPRAFYDCNPTNKMHWTYKLFIQKVDPDSKVSLPNPEDYVHCKMNPEDNKENLSSTYLNTLNALSARLRKRFKDGDFADATPNALFNDVTIETWRHMDGPLPDMVRVVVSVDPSGAGDKDNADNDAIGIVAVGLGVDGNAYVLEDNTVKAGPKVWGTVATTAYDRLEADCIVGETNYGGAMVNFVIQTCRPRTPFRQVTASRGKHVRAEPFSALYEQGKVRHVGTFDELEEEIVHFSTVGYVGTGSPNRADALFWALAALFPGLVKGGKKAASEEDEEQEHWGAGAWMG